MSTESSSQLDLNHWLIRLVAFIIDSIIIGIVASIIYYLILVPLIWPSTYIFGIYAYGGAPWWAFYFVFWFILGIIEVLYFVLMEASSGATLGKKVLGLHVQMVNGSKVMFDKAFIRNISKIYGLFLLLDWILGVATPGPDRRQKYTDRIAGTTVVSVKPAFTTTAATPPPPPPPPPAS
jgi:uncharacterized RDD family membrane protein YckC